MAFITRNPKKAIATIANGGTTSGAIDIRNASIIGIITPSALTGTAITITVSDSQGGTYVPLRSSGSSAISLTVATGGAYPLSVNVEPWSWMKLVSGSAEAAERSITVVMK